MPREKEQYRENLMALGEAFPGKELICLKDAARYIVRVRRLASWLS